MLDLWLFEIALLALCAVLVAALAANADAAKKVTYRDSLGRFGKISGQSNTRSL